MTRMRIGGGLVLALGCLSGAGTALAETELLPQVPYDAELMPRADKDLTLDVTWTGERYIAVGDRGHILASLDGEEWVQVPAPVRSPLTAVSFPTPRQGWAVGHDSVILHSADGGRSWERQNFEPELNQPFHDVLFTDERTGVAIGAYGLAYVTSDGGKNWQELEAPAIRGDEFHLNSISRLGDGRFFVAGEFGTLAVADTLEGPWRRLKPPYGSSLFGAMPLGDKGVVIYGLRGNVFVSRDVDAVPSLPEGFDPVLMSEAEEAILDGEGWQTVQTKTVNSMFGGVQLPDGGYVLVGLNGEALHLDPQGERVASMSTESELPLAAAQLGPEGGLILAGEDGLQQLPLR